MTSEASPCKSRTQVFHETLIDPVHSHDLEIRPRVRQPDVIVLAPAVVRLVELVRSEAEIKLPIRGGRLLGEFFQRSYDERIFLAEQLTPLPSIAQVCGIG